MTSTTDDSLMHAADCLQKLISQHSLSPEELERRKRAAQRLKERYSSIPWYREQGEKHGDRFWENLQSKAPLRD